MQRVIGLDIGSYSIKAVEIVNTLNSYEIQAFYENVIPQINELSQDVIIPACMEQLFRENNLQADRIVTAMPGQYVSSRIMGFNFSDPAKIQNAIFAEVEDVVPYHMDDMILDHQVLGNMKNQTVALAVMTRKSFLSSFLDHLQRINIDPKVVDVDSLAFYNLSPYLEVEPEECYAIIDVGHDKTSICVIHNDVLRMFRSINLGGRYLTEFLSRDLEVDFNEAQRVKHEISRVLCDSDQGEDLDSRARMISMRLTLASNAIVKELGRTLYAFKNWEHHPVTKIFLSGGTSKIVNFDRYLQDHLEIQVLKSRLNESNLKISEELKPYMEVMPQSLAIGMRAVSSIKRHSEINLRKDEFAYVQDYESALRGIAVASKIVAIVVFLLAIAYTIQYVVYSKSIGVVQEDYINTFVKYYPKERSETKNIKNFKEFHRKTKKKIEGEIASIDETMNLFLETSSSSGALVSLGEISRQIPKEVKVDLTLYQYTTNPDGTGAIVIKGDTDSFESVESIKEYVKKVNQLQNVSDKNSDKKPGYDNVIDFTINAQYVPTNAKG